MAQTERVTMKVKLVSEVRRMKGEFSGLDPHGRLGTYGRIDVYAADVETDDGTQLTMHVSGRC